MKRRKKKCKEKEVKQPVADEKNVNGHAKTMWKIVLTNRSFLFLHLRMAILT